MRKLIVILLLAWASVARGQVIETVVNQLQCLGTPFDVTVVITAGSNPVDDAAAFFNFDPTILQVTSITPGGALPSVDINQFDNTVGTIDYSAGINQPATATGTFGLCVIHFNPIGSGTSPFNFLTALPRTSGAFFQGSAYPMTFNNANIVVGPCGPTPTATKTPTPTHTQTPIATATATPNAFTQGCCQCPGCCGDCDGNGTINPGEQALCTQAATTGDRWWCPTADCNQTGTVTVDDCLMVQHFASVGCQPMNQCASPDVLGMCPPGCLLILPHGLEARCQ